MNEYTIEMKTYLRNLIRNGNETCLSMRWKLVFRYVYQHVVVNSDISDKTLKKHYNNLSVAELIDNYFDQLSVEQKVELFALVIRRAYICM